MAKKAAAPRTRKPRPPARPEASVTVRMYCQGLGDCFLLTFRLTPDAQPVRVLIDCGVFLLTPGEAPKLRQVAESLRAETGGVFDLLIITHEHWDHVAGFAHANDLFETFRFGNVWLSWVEDGDDPDAQQLKRELGKTLKALRAAVPRARIALADRQEAGSYDPVAARLEADLTTAGDLLDFLGPPDAGANGQRIQPASARRDATPHAAAARVMSLDAAMNWLRAKARPQDYCSPGQVRPLPGADGVKAYVLGPPRSSRAIRKEDPSRGQGYGLQADRVSLLGALDWLASGGDEAPPGPFDARHRMTPEDARLDPFFRETYGFADDPLGDAGQAWRRIEDEWLGGIGHLALQLDTGVNNTSLALAFELPDGRTLIFPGDAQIGNWLSWAEVRFKGPDGRDLDVTSKQLLSRAILYKVGHHGSHNATLKPGGLEAMTGVDLVAMIPTDEAYARTKKPPADGWKMPQEKLNEALLNATHRRVLRADLAGKAALVEMAGDEAKSPRWQEFSGRVSFAAETFAADPDDLGPARPLYVEYRIPL